MKQFQNIDSILMHMEVYGGTFEAKLAALYRCADDFNRKRLMIAFNNVFNKYFVPLGAPATPSI